MHARLLIDGGELLLEGRPKTVVSQYQRLVNLSSEEAAGVREEIRRISVDAGEDGPAAGADGPGPAAVLAPGSQAAVPPPASLEGYDPSLTPKSRVDYESHGAAIRDLSLLNVAGERVNILEMGRRYTYEYFVDFSADAAEVGFGMLIKTTSGFGIGGATTAYSRALKMPRVASGSIVQVGSSSIAGCFRARTFSTPASPVREMATCASSIACSTAWPSASRPCRS